MWPTVKQDSGKHLTGLYGTVAMQDSSTLSADNVHLHFSGFGGAIPASQSSPNHLPQPSTSLPPQIPLPPLQTPSHLKRTAMLLRCAIPSPTPLHSFLFHTIHVPLLLHLTHRSYPRQGVCGRCPSPSPCPPTLSLLQILGRSVRRWTAEAKWK